MIGYLSVQVGYDKDLDTIYVVDQQLYLDKWDCYGDVNKSIRNFAVSHNEEVPELEDDKATLLLDDGTQYVWEVKEIEF